MRRIINTITLLVLILYPLVIFFGLKRWGVSAIAPWLLLLFLLRLLQRPSKSKELFFAGAGIACIGAVLAFLSWVMKESGWLLYYPVMVSLVLLLVFGVSLLKPPTLVERLARLTDPELPAEAVAYTRKVTIIWCLFFLINGSIALGTIFSGNMAAWTLYNGAISYVLMGCLMGGEWLVRRKVRRGMQKGASA